MSDSNEILQNIQNKPGVLGTIIITPDGIPIKTTFSNTETSRYAGFVSDFIRQTNSTLNATKTKEKLQCVRVRSFKNEILIFPDKSFILIVIQDTFTTN